VADTLRILLVDGQAARCELLKIVLDAAIDGCYVDVVGDPIRLGEMLQSTDVAAIVVAHPCPWLDGFELLERVRQAFPHKPVLLLADEASEEVASAALRLGAADLVVHDDSAPLRVRDALVRILAAHGGVERRGADRRAPSSRPRNPRPAPDGIRLPGGAEPLTPTLPGTPVPRPEGSPRTTADSSTATMKALVRNQPERALDVDLSAADLPTELGRPGLEELVQHADVGWFRCDVDGFILDLNDALLTLMEASRGDIRLNRLGLTQPRWRSFIQAVRSNGSVTETWLELKTVTGARRVVSLTLRGSSEGRTRAVIDGLVVDTTGLATDPSASASVIELDEVRRAKELAEETRRERDRLVELSHDLQEPLRTVRIYADLLEEKHADSLDDEARTMLQRSREAAARMEEMVSSLVVDATVRSRPEPVSADSEEVLRGVLSNLAGSITESSAAISSDSLPIVGIPPGQMTQLLQNLLSNAIKYRSTADPRVHISAERGNGEWLFTVTDNGTGIPEEYQARVFEMFERGSEVESVPGSGIGLAVCRRVVESHGGRIWVVSTPGEGSTFQFTVPIASTETLRSGNSRHI
jgi:signal transduction histidine kinase/DNA-binding NarL/FixJ family response regulator